MTHASIYNRKCMVLDKYWIFLYNNYK